MESFFATLKGELVEERDYPTRGEARAGVRHSSMRQPGAVDATATGA
jgi:hypothetical protein